MSLLCPKCHNVMNQYERNRVHVDQCVECGGLFLDRGELDHLIKAEAIFYGESAAGPVTPVAPVASAPPRYEEQYDRRYEQRHAQDRQPQQRYPSREDEKYYKKKKRRGFLEDLLDF